MMWRLLPWSAWFSPLEKPGSGGLLSRNDSGKALESRIGGKTRCEDTIRLPGETASQPGIRMRFPKDARDSKCDLQV